jgi:Cof subfamily protein (haloacid dehalogenase superfamily)
MTNPIKLIAVDLDGTLLNSQHLLTERTEKTLKAAIEKGLEVVLATGKTHASAREIIQKLNLKSLGIYLQGLAIYDGDGHIRHQQTLDLNLARQVITFAEDRGFPVAAYCGDRILVRRIVKLVDELIKYQEPMPEAVGPLQNILDAMPVNKLIAIGDPHRIKSLRWQLSMQLNGSVRLMQTHLVEMLEILPPGASKGAALKVVLKDSGVGAHEVLAIGDAENDVEMIQLAGIGVAVGNADAKAKEAADYVVASNDEDGVAEAVERFVLGIDKAKEEAPKEAKPVEAKVVAEPKSEVKPS